MPAVASKSSSIPPGRGTGAGLAEKSPVGDEAMGVRMHFDRDEEIFGEDEPAQYVYRVLSGAVRTARMQSDGRRQIVEFHLPGDVFGLDGEARHALGAEAIVETVLQVVRRSTFMASGIDGAGTAVQALLRKFHRAQAHMLLLGRQTACERVASFLLDFQNRTKGQTFDLPMSRQDIADYLGLTIETVSRTFSQLERDKAIAIPQSRHIVLGERLALIGD